MKTEILAAADCAVSTIVARARRLESIASGYWTLPLKQSSGLVSH